MTARFDPAGKQTLVTSRTPAEDLTGTITGLFSATSNFVRDQAVLHPGRYTGRNRQTSE
jgi:hypothetical protein